jgi:hypothetical protein
MVRDDDDDDDVWEEKNLIVSQVMYMVALINALQDDVDHSADFETEIESEFASNGTNESDNDSHFLTCLASSLVAFTHGTSFSRVLRVNSFYRPVSE